MKLTDKQKNELYKLYKDAVVQVKKESLTHFEYEEYNFELEQLESVRLIQTTIKQRETEEEYINFMKIDADVKTVFDTAIVEYIERRDEEYES
ncbi:hypothetical protein AALF85_05325 [Jeotgalicoccus halotolerans]|uniref:hypothetical protein n=1 Tax=Jeotgalicoccus halotolerans TaxID=157227 RepID=UPI003513E724